MNCRSHSMRGAVAAACLFLVAMASHAGAPGKEPPTEQQVRKWNAGRPVRLQENMGQVLDIHGEPAPFVLFRAQALGMCAFVTETGLTYAIRKKKRDQAEEERERERQEALKSGRIPRDEEPDHRHVEQDAPTEDWEMNWVHVRLDGAHILRENVMKEEESLEHVNFHGKHFPNGIYDVHEYGKVTIRDVYPGIDWVIRSDKEQGFKYDFVVHPGADASRIVWTYFSAKPITVDEEGSLLMRTRLGTLKEQAPYSYLQGSNAEVPCTYEREQLDGHRVRIRYKFDGTRVPRNSTLVIDPQLVWSTWTVTDQVDGAMVIKTQSNGNVITSGYGGHGFIGFPTPFDTLSFSGASASNTGSFIHAFSGTGVLLWSSLEEGATEMEAMAIDVNDRIFLRSGLISGTSLQPGTGSFTGAYFNDTLTGGYLVAFSEQGVREWATLLPGDWGSSYFAIATDAAGRILVTGQAWPGIVAQPGIGSFTGAYFAPPAINETYLMGFAPNGALEWATGFPVPSDYGSTPAIGFAPNGSFFLANGTGEPTLPVLATGAFAGATTNAFSGSAYDGYIAGFTTNGVQQWGTYFGIGDGGSLNSMAVDGNGRVVVCGTTGGPVPLVATGTFSSGYQDGTLGGGVDPFIVGFGSGGVLQWSTLLGGSGVDQYYNKLNQLGIDGAGNIFTSFDSGPGGIPVLDNGCGSPLNGLNYTNFGLECLMRFAPNGALTWVNYFGPGWRTPIAVTAAGDLYTTGEYGPGTPLLDPGAGAWFQNYIPNMSDDAIVAHFAPSPCDTTSSPLYVTLDCTSIACYGECNATCTAQGIQGAAPYSYAWNNGTTGTTATGLCGGTGTVTVTDATGETATFVFSVVQPAAVSVSTSASASSCISPTGAATVDVLGIDAANYTIAWSNGQSSAVIVGLSPGGYTVLVTDTITGCTYPDSVTVPGVSDPNAVAAALTDPIDLGGSTQLVGGGTGNYQWTPATGLSCTTCASPIATPTDTTTYCLVVMDANQCSDTACVTINVVVPPPPCYVFVPSAFSPNASGKNDTQCVYGACITTMVFSIYDRWGNKVFESADPKQCWDGTFKGQALDPAVFVYKLTATMTTGEMVEKQGNITLVR